MAEPSPNHSPSGTPMKAEERPRLAGLCSITRPESTACQPCTALPAGIITSPLSPLSSNTSARTRSCMATGSPANQGWAVMKRWACGAVQSMLRIVAAAPAVQGNPLAFVGWATGVGAKRATPHTAQPGNPPGTQPKGALRRPRSRPARVTMIAHFTTISKEHTCWA